MLLDDLLSGLLPTNIGKRCSRSHVGNLPAGRLTGGTRRDMRHL